MVQAVSRRLLNSRSHFDVWPGHVEFVVDKVALGQVSLRVLRLFSCRRHSTSAHARLYLYVAVSRRTNGLNLETFQNATLFGKSGHWMEKYFPHFSN